jgi:hypothetical protein
VVEFAARGVTEGGKNEFVHNSCNFFMVPTRTLFSGLLSRTRVRMKHLVPREKVLVREESR